jgi:RimJ/RimL family protein N-acetyltransferase
MVCSFGTAAHMIQLRELTGSDLVHTLRWRQDPTLITWLGEPFRHINCETEETWFQHYLAHRNQQVRLMIWAGAQAIGLVQLTGIHTVHRSAEFSLLIGEAAFRGQGYGHEATRHCLQHAFSDLNLHRLELRVRADNQPALRLYRRVGFVEEGRLRQAIFKQGQRIDLLIMGLLAHDYQG